MKPKERINSKNIFEGEGSSCCQEGFMIQVKIKIYWFVFHCFKETTRVRLTLKNLSFWPEENL